MSPPRYGGGGGGGGGYGRPRSPERGFREDFREQGGDPWDRRWAQPGWLAFKLSFEQKCNILQFTS